MSKLLQVEHDYVLPSLMFLMSAIVDESPTALVPSSTRQTTESVAITDRYSTVEFESSARVHGIEQHLVPSWSAIVVPVNFLKGLSYSIIYTVSNSTNGIP